MHVDLTSSRRTASGTGADSVKAVDFDISRFNDFFMCLRLSLFTVEILKTFILGRLPVVLTEEA